MGEYCKGRLINIYGGTELLRAAYAKANRIRKAELLEKMLELSLAQPDEDSLGGMLQQRQRLMDEIQRLDSEYLNFQQPDKTLDQCIKSLLEALIQRDRELMGFAAETLESMKHEVKTQRRQLKRASIYAGAYSPQSRYIDRKE